MPTENDSIIGVSVVPLTPSKVFPGDSSDQLEFPAKSLLTQMKRRTTSWYPELDPIPVTDGVKFYSFLHTGPRLTNDVTEFNVCFITSRNKTLYSLTMNDSACELQL